MNIQFSIRPRRPRSARSAGSSALCAAVCLSFFGLVLLSEPVRASDDISLYRAREEEGYFVRASAKAFFNVGVSVETVRPVLPEGEYADGYVLRDIGGSDLTWNWGYDSAAEQIDTAADQLGFERYDGLPPLGTQEETAVAPGGEIMAGLEIGAFELAGRTVRWGLEVGYGFNYLTVDTGGSADSTVTYTTAAYALNGVTPPGDAYAGTVVGPGPVIGVTPATTGSTSALSTSTYTGELDSLLHNFKFGFWFDYPISDSLFTSLSLGYSSIYADAQFKYTEILTPDPMGAYPESNTVGGRDNWKSGVYVQWRLGYQVSKRVDVFLGLDYQWNDKMVFSGSDRNVTLDFSAMLGASAGVQLNF
jgi:hypothetical protein